MAYPAPADVGSVSGFDYYLVAIPADPAYRQAAMGALHELSRQQNWGMDSPDPDRVEIEQQWLAAIVETLRLLSMDPLTTIIGHIDELETLISQLIKTSQCCPENVTYGPPSSRDNPDSYTYDGPSYPSTWGESATPSSLAEWQDLVCGAAHDYVDHLVYIGYEIDTLMTDTLLTIAAIAGVLGLLATGGWAAIVAASIAGAAFQAILSDWSADLFTDAADAIEAARADIVCAFISGSEATLKAEIQSTISATAYAALYQWPDYQSAINTALYGEWDGNYLPERSGEDCDCGLPDPEASGLYFEETGGTVTPHNYDTYPDSLDGVEMYYYQIYKIRGPHPGAIDFRFDDHVGATYVDVVWNILHTIGDDPEVCSQCDADPRLKGYLAAAPTTIDWQVSRADCIADYSGTQTACRARYDCCGCNSSTTKGYLEVYFTPAS